jgi:hypothetical protein
VIPPALRALKIVNGENPWKAYVVTQMIFVERDDRKHLLPVLSLRNPLSRRPATLVLRKIPFILMTNGGGVTERLRALALSRLLGYPVRRWYTSPFAHSRS